MKEAQLCYTCRWGWHFNEEYEGDIAHLQGYCHRYAPKPQVVNDVLKQCGIMWPPVNGDDGCGEWTSRFI